MPDEEKKIIVDEDWKAQAKREKERAEEDMREQQPLPEPSFSELINLIVVQALAGLGLLAGPRGERIPPNLEMAKHFIDMLQLIEDKTKGNLTDEERQLLDQVLYETRMSFVQVAQGGGPMGPGPSGARAPEAAEPQERAPGTPGTHG